MKIDFSFLFSIVIYGVNMPNCDRIIAEYKGANVHSNTYTVTYFDGKRLITKRLVDIF